MKKLIIGCLLAFLTLIPFSVAIAVTEAETEAEDVLTEDGEEPEVTYLEAVINVSEAVEIQKSVIFDAAQSFIPDKERRITYEWDFGDGNKNQGSEVLHAYKEPGKYIVTLKIEDGVETSETQKEVFAYEKLIFLITDIETNKDQIEVITKNYAENRGVYLKVIESYGSSTEFISEEVLTKKLTEEANILEKAGQILIWTKENAGLNALSRFVQTNLNRSTINFSQKTITVIADSLGSSVSRIQRQFSVLNPTQIIVAKEGAIPELIDSKTNEEFIAALNEGGHTYEIITSESGKLRPWNFMSYFVNYLVDQGIPDNTIALLLLLPVIATVVAFMKQIVGMTTFGIYTPSIITLSFLIIGLPIGLMVLILAILVGSVTRPALKKVRMLFIPKMAIVITIVSSILFLILIASSYFELLDAPFLSIAIFPMLILSTLVEKFVSVKTEKGLTSAIVLMTETVVVSIIAYVIAGGEISLGGIDFRFDFIKHIMITYPELIFLLIIIDVLLGKWSGLRILERIRFREVLRHIEEEE